MSLIHILSIVAVSSASVSCAPRTPPSPDNASAPLNSPEVLVRSSSLSGFWKGAFLLQQAGTSCNVYECPYGGLEAEASFNEDGFLLSGAPQVVSQIAPTRFELDIDQTRAIGGMVMRHRNYHVWEYQDSSTLLYKLVQGRSVFDDRGHAMDRYCECVYYARLRREK